jgi:hypothetical protein
LPLLHITVCLLLLPASFTYSSSLKMEAIHPSETSTKLYQITWCRIPEGTTRSRDSVVGRATGYGLDDRGVGVPSPGRVKNFLFSTWSKPALGPTQPPIQWVPGALSPGVKRQGREADHSPPASAEVKKTWIYTSTPPYAFMA